MGKLNKDQAEEVIAAAIDQELFDGQKRKALLSGVKPRIVAEMRVTDIPADQVRSDIHKLNELAEAGTPASLKRYLQNAEELAPDGGKFKSARIALAGSQKAFAAATGLFALLRRRITIPIGLLLVIGVLLAGGVWWLWRRASNAKAR